MRNEAAYDGSQRSHCSLLPAIDPPRWTRISFDLSPPSYLAYSGSDARGLTKRQPCFQTWQRVFWLRSGDDFPRVLDSSPGSARVKGFAPVQHQYTDIFWVSTSSWWYAMTRMPIIWNKDAWVENSLLIIQNRMPKIKNEEFIDRIICLLPPSMPPIKYKVKSIYHAYDKELPDLTSDEISIFLSLDNSNHWRKITSNGFNDKSSPTCEQCRWCLRQVGWML